MASPTDKVLLEYVVPLSVSLVSLLACIILAIRLRMLPRACQHRLLVRQLWHIAVADGAFAVVMSSGLVLSLGHAMGSWDITEGGAANWYCTVDVLLKNSANQSSMLLEMHIAMAFLAASFRGVRTMKVLCRLLPACWVIGVCLAIMDVAIMRPRWWDKYHDCGTKDPEGVDGLQTWVMTVCMLFCTLCYLGSSLFVCSSGEVVQQRVWLRMGCYVLVAPFVYGPLWYYYWIFPHNLDHEKPAAQIAVLCVARCFWGAGGLLNFLLYAVQSRYMRVDMRNTAQRTGSPGATALSFRVGFRDAESVLDDPPLLASAPDSAGSRRTQQSTLGTADPSGQYKPGEDLRNFGAAAAGKCQETGSLLDYHMGAFNPANSNDLTGSTAATSHNISGGNSRLRCVTPRGSLAQSGLSDDGRSTDSAAGAAGASVTLAPPADSQ